MQRKKDLVSAVQNRREPLRHLLEKKGTWKFYDEVLRISQEFPEKYSLEFLGISWEKFQRNFQEFLETKSLIPFANQKNLSNDVLKIFQWVLYLT